MGVIMSVKTNHQAAKTCTQQKYYVTLASDLTEIRQAQALRYQIFAEEMGAHLETPVPYHDIDQYDRYCHHILVKEQETNQIISCTRVLTSDQVTAAGGFYSESEFDLSQILRLNGRFMEIGRTCVHADYRNGSILSLLWSGIARFMVENKFNYLMGCASVPMPDNHRNILFKELAERYALPNNIRVYPKVPLQAEESDAPRLVMPSLLKAYLRVGAKICGEPCWDPHFKVADVFILVYLENIQQRYAKHFVQRAQSAMQRNFHNVVAA